MHSLARVQMEVLTTCNQALDVRHIWCELGETKQDGNWEAPSIGQRSRARVVFFWAEKEMCVSLLTHCPGCGPKSLVSPSSGHRFCLFEQFPCSSILLGRLKRGKGKIFLQCGLFISLIHCWRAEKIREDGGAAWRLMEKLKTLLARLGSFLVT